MSRDSNQSPGFALGALPPQKHAAQRDILPRYYMERVACNHVESDFAGQCSYPG
jgi:hypothetical protein